MKFSVLKVVVAVLAMSMFSTAAQAEWIDTFDNTVNGGFHQTWIPGNVTGLGGESGTFDFSTTGGMLQVQDPTVVNGGGAASGYGLVDEVFDDFFVGEVLNPGTETDMNREVGVLGRISGASAVTMTGYILTVDYFNNSGALSLSKLNVGLDIGGLDSDTLSSFTSADSVYIELQGSGSTIVGRAYSEIGGSLLASVSAVDTSYTAGLSGVVVNSQDNPTVALRGTYGMVMASIPEPGSVAMLISGCLCAFGLVWRRRQRQS